MSPSPSRTSDLLARLGLPLSASAVIVALWHIAVVQTHSKVMPTPLAVLLGLLELERKGILFSYLVTSLARVLAGYGLAVCAGVPLGMAMGWYPMLALPLQPLFQLLRPISPIAWIPIAIVLFGVGNTTTVFLIFIASFFPIVMAAMNGARGVPLMYLRAGRNFGLSPVGILRRVLFPAMLPDLLTGLRVALGIAWLVVVAAEMVAVNSGLGYLIIDARNAGKRYDLVIAGMLLIGLVGLALDVLIRQVERLPSVRWGVRVE